jgi:uncharacterized SAM-binding protein YcdF (DUF218 family)
MFLFKKLIAPLLFPIPIILFLFVVGLIQMWRSRHRRSRKGAGWILAGTLLLIALSFRPIPMMMLSALEDQYPPVDVVPDTTIKWVVVLAAGASDDPSLPTTYQLSSSSTVRVVEGIRLVRQLPSAQLILSGGAPFSSLPAASAMRELALDLGLPDSIIVLEDRSFDTKDQAVEIASMVGHEPFMLVTSAMHMPRSMSLFVNQGTTPIAAPTDHIARRPKTIHPGGFYPSSLNLRAARTAWREFLGLAWAKIRGQA